MMLRKISKLLAVMLCVGCAGDEEPAYSIIPHIELESLEFIKGSPIPNPTDTLKVTISFRDGDMDLGLPFNNFNDPYHHLDYFLEGPDGSIIRIPTHFKMENLPAVFLKTNGHTGKLVTIRTRQKTGFEYLPPYEAPFICKHYTGIAYTPAPDKSFEDYINTNFIVISEEDKSIIDDTYHIIDTIELSTSKAYVLTDTLYHEPNPYFFNITMDFLIKNDDGSFEPFDWSEFSCKTTFNGRFPVIDPNYIGLPYKSGPFRISLKSSQRGVLEYKIISIGFKQLFAAKILKLRIKITDRALQESNTLETTEFTIAE